jgi:hypothetical protein
MSKPSKMGRPTNYRAKFCEEIIKYFDKPLYIKVIQQKMSASGVVKEIEVSVANDMPTFEGFAVDICKVSACKLTEWAKKHDEFRKAMKKAKAIQKKFLLNHAMNGNYNSSFAKFFAINCLDMKETSHVETKNEHEVKGYGLAFDLSKKPEDIK